MKVIKDNEELKSYIKNGVIAFEESIECDFDIDVDASIIAWDINARNIKARNIKAGDISYYASCISYNSIKCNSIAPRRENGFHKCLDGELTILPKKRVITIDNKEIEISEESYQEFVKQFKD